MIKVSFISPTAYIAEYGDRGDFHLALSHLLPNWDTYKNAYQKALEKSKLPKYIDNGLFENKIPEGESSLFKKAQKIKAEYIFIPDILYDRKKTELNIMKASMHPDWVSGELAGVIQADNPDDYIASYQWMVDNPNISLIGLSILSIPQSFREVTNTDDITTNRLYCLEQLNKLDKHKASHLLGAGSSYEDVAYAAKNCKWIVSHDSSSAIWNGLDGRRIDSKTLKIEGGKSPRHVDFNHKEKLTKQQKVDIEHNIKVVLSVCHKT